MSYDEFGLFHENAEEFGLPYDGVAGRAARVGRRRRRRTERERARVG